MRFVHTTFHDNRAASDSMMERTEYFFAKRKQMLPTKISTSPTSNVERRPTKSDITPAIKLPT